MSGLGNQGLSALKNASQTSTSKEGGGQLFHDEKNLGETIQTYSELQAIFAEDKPELANLTPLEFAHYLLAELKKSKNL